jgi:hypothetical protein
MALQHQPPPRKRIPRGGPHDRHTKDAQRRGDDTRDRMAHRRRLLAAYQAKRAAPHDEVAEGRQADPQHEEGGTQGGVDTWATAEAGA